MEAMLGLGRLCCWKSVGDGEAELQSEDIPRVANHVESSQNGLGVGLAGLKFAARPSPRRGQVGDGVLD